MDGRLLWSSEEHDQRCGDDDESEEGGRGVGTGRGVAEIPLAEAHEHLLVVVDRVCAAVLRVLGAPLQAHSLRGHVVVCRR